MKKIFFIGAFALIAAVAMIAYTNSTLAATDTLLSNVEALAQGEDGDGNPIYYPCTSYIYTGYNWGFCYEQGYNEVPISFYETYYCQTWGYYGAYCQVGTVTYYYRCNDTYPYSSGYITNEMCSY